MRLTVVGCGDAFGSGGRLQTCFHVASSAGAFLIDCGATVMVGLSRLGLDPNRIDTVFLSHLHGDHFGGLPLLLLHAEHVARRAERLLVVGPEGTEERLRVASEALYPRSMTVERRFPLAYADLRERQRLRLGDIAVTPFEVDHYSGAPPYALRFEIEGKVVAFSGDSEWTDSLIEAGRGADLYIVECYRFAGAPKFHLSYETIAARAGRIGAKRVLLTHMSEEMLARRGEVDRERFLLAEDGMTLDI